MPDLERYPLHLGLGSIAVPQPEFTGELEWYETYIARAISDGSDGRLVTMHRFLASWTSWEMHPHGEEVVLCTDGRITLHQEMADGSKQSVTIGAGEYAVNPAGAWHTADVDGEATAVFITPGLGTEHRPRI